AVADELVELLQDLLVVALRVGRELRVVQPVHQLLDLASVRPGEGAVHVPPEGEERPRELEDAPLAYSLCAHVLQVALDEELVLLGERGPVYPLDTCLEPPLIPLYVGFLFLHGAVSRFRLKRRKGAT